MLTTLMLSACLVCQTGTQEYREPEPEINWHANTNTEPESYYKSTLKTSRLLSTPRWAPEQENPPLSARKAIALANDVMRKLVPYGKDTKLTDPVLKLRESHGHWFWVVYFSPDDWRQFTTTFPVVVLMDGAAIEPQRVAPPPPPFQNRTQPETQ